MIAFLLLGLAAAPLASAGESHGYPQTTSSYSSFSQSSESRTTEEVEGAWSDEDASQYGEASGHRAWREKAEQYGSDRYGYSAEGYSSERFAHGYGRRIADSDVDENGVGYLPVSFFSDAGGVGPYGDFGNGGGGGGFVYGGGFASGFAGAHASASASASATISITGGFHGGWRGGGMHGGYPHGGGHGCGCK